MPIVIAIAVAGVYAAISISREMDRREVESLASLPTITAADQARLDAYRGAEARRRERFDARDARTIRATIGTEACPIDVTPPRELPEGVAVTGSWGALERDFMSSLRTYLIAFGDGMEVMPLAREGVGPITRSTGDSYAYAARDHELVLVVESWVDPILPEHIPPEGTTFTVGRLTGRLLLWSYQEDRVVCAAEVDATNAPVTVVRSNLDGRSDHPLDRARIDLVVQAVRSGASALRAATPGAELEPSALFFMGSAGDQSAVAITTADDGDSVAAIAFQGGIEALDVAGERGTAIVRFDPAGSARHTRVLEGAITVSAIDADASGVLIAGELVEPREIAGRTIAPGGLVMAIDGDSDRWAISIGPAAIASVVSDGEGGAIVVGDARDTIACGPRTTGHEVHFIARIDRTGRCAWMRTARAELHYRAGFHHVEIAHGEVHVAGVFGGAIDVDGAQLESDRTAALLASWTLRGRRSRALVVDSGPLAIASSIAPASDESLWVLVTRQDSPVDGTITIPIDGASVPHGEHRVFRVARSGELTRAVTLEGGAGAFPSMVSDGNGGAHVVGTYRNTLASGERRLSTPVNAIYHAHVDASGALAALDDVVRTPDLLPSAHVTTDPRGFARILGSISTAGTFGATVHTADSTDAFLLSDSAP